MNIVPFVIITALCYLLVYLIQRPKSGSVIRSSRFGILNLKGDDAVSLIVEDTETLAPVIGRPSLSTTCAPQCDVLFLYCDVGHDGSIQNYDAGLREIIRDSGAVVVVIASENGSDAYIASGKQGKDKIYGRANLVMTMQRRGPIFPTFFARLFSEMKRGVPMPMAWVKLAPQVPGLEHADCPSLIFACEAGLVTFR